MNTLESSAFRVVHENITQERLDGETIAINLVTGRYYSMSGPAADVFSGITSGTPFTVWWPAIQSVFGGTARAEDLTDFFDALVEAGLICSTEEENSHTFALPEDYERSRWTSPVLSEFEDLQDLILVDPIHDTSNLGWPHVRDDSD
jgi:hypothetical protein